MILFINNPGSEILPITVIRTAIQQKKISIIPLEVGKDTTDKDIEKILHEGLTSSSYEKQDISLIVFHPSLRTGSVPIDLIPLVVRSIKGWSNAFLLTISSGGQKDCLIPAKNAGSDEAIPIAQFCEIWRTASDDEGRLLNQLIKYSKRTEIESLVIEIPYLFLSLDIDIQALEVLDNRKKKREQVKNPQEYLKEMYADNIDYLQKFEHLRAKVNELGEIEGINKERLKELAGYNNKGVSQFFEKLKDKKDDPDEFLGHTWGIEGVESFHDWYCALASCLRGEEACN